MHDDYTQLPELLQKILFMFVAKPEDARSHLHAPFRVDDNLCATDGHVAIFVESDLGEPNKVDNVTKVLREKYANRPKRYLPWENIHIPEPEITPCEECEGQGAVEISNDFNTYDVTCQTCHGQRSFEKPVWVEFPNVEYKFDARAMAKIAKIPGVKIAFEGRELHFKFEGGCGLLTSAAT
jgi:hypothetical protein